MEQKFFVVKENGEKIQATPITRLKLDGKDIEYFYYSIDEGNNEVSILASRIGKDEDDNEILIDLENEEERQMAYELFSETYKKIKEKQNGEEIK